MKYPLIAAIVVTLVYWASVFALVPACGVMDSATPGVCKYYKVFNVTI